MKKWIISTGTFILLSFLLSPAVYAEDISFSVGLKSWYNQWSQKRAGKYIKSDDLIFLVGPSLKASKGKAFAGVSYLMSAEDYIFSNLDAQGDRQEMARKDFDVLVGYMLHPRYGLTAGYKYVTADGLYIQAGQPSQDFESSVKGPAFGVTFNDPIEDTGAVLVLNINYLAMSMVNRAAGVRSGVDGDGYVVDMAVSFGLFEGASASLGYKHQVVNFEGGEDNVFSGATIGIDYRF